MLDIVDFLGLRIGLLTDCYLDLLVSVGALLKILSLVVKTAQINQIIIVHH